MWNDGRCLVGVVVALVDGLGSVGLGLVAHSLAPSVKNNCFVIVHVLSF